MAVMRAAFYRSFGEAVDVIEVGEVPRPEPDAGEVLVEIAVAGVNPTDWKARRGSRPMTFPFVVPGQDGAGTIRAVGDGVSDDRIGERVWVYFARRERQYGTAGEFTAVPSDQAVHLPDGVSLDLGASMGVPALTAHRALHWGGTPAGATVLVTGGAGAVGHYAIELARVGGAGLVIATVSGPEKAKLASAAGADLVINYRTEDVADRIRRAAPGGVDRIVEVAIGANLATTHAVLAPHGTLVSYAQDAEPAVLDVRSLMFGNQTLRFMMLYDVEESAIRAGVDAVADAMVRGALSELPATRFRLEETAAAHEACERGAVGKVFIDV